MIGQEGQRGYGLPDRANATQKDIRAVEITLEAQFSAELTEPENGSSCPGATDVEHKLGGEQDQDKQAAHAFQTLDAQVFDIQSLFLIKAIAVFNATA